MGFSPGSRGRTDGEGFAGGAGGHDNVPGNIGMPREAVRMQSRMPRLKSAYWSI